MSGLELNKIIAAILVASLVAMIAGVAANILYKPKLEAAERGYKIEVAEGEEVEGVGVAAAEAPLDIEKLMTVANAEAGAKAIKKCVSCHTFEQGGANKVGPNLWKIVDAPKGKKADFAYSKAMATADGVWDLQSLFGFLAKPEKYMPGTKMSFAGISKPQEIADVIAYLQLQEKAN